jgi:hypothetical protein
VINLGVIYTCLTWVRYFDVMAALENGVFAIDTGATAFFLANKFVRGDECRNLKHA